MNADKTSHREADPGSPSRPGTAKAEVISWLNRSLDAVKSARAGLKPAYARMNGIVPPWSEGSKK